MPIEIVDIVIEKFFDLISRGEGHFLEFKSMKIMPARLTRTLSAFSNADGGELYVGIEDGVDPLRDRWNGFSLAEDANGHIQAFEQFFPLGTYFRYDFLRCGGLPGLILHCEIAKTPDVRFASDRKAYRRRGPQNLPQDTEEKLTRLRLNKGIMSYEDHVVNADLEEITNSAAIIDFMLENIPDSEPDRFLHKQHLLFENRPKLAAVVLYADDPQTILPNTGIKIYQYQTSEEGTRDTLIGNPATIEGCAYKLITEAVQTTINKINAIPVLGSEGFEKVSYPREAIHEIITNAVLHRDYSMNDEVHVRIFNNRIEVQSPGTLPGHVTVKNILDERFSRNPRIVRLINNTNCP